MNAYRPRLSLHSAGWPAELVAQGDQIARGATWRSWKTVLLISVTTGLVFGVVSLATPNSPNWIRFLIYGASGVASMFIIRAVLRRRTRDDVARLLIDNGYCVCGYPFQTQGIIRSCPECGRQWTERALPRD